MSLRNAAISPLFRIQHDRRRKRRVQVNRNARLNTIGSRKVSEHPHYRQDGPQHPATMKASKAFSVPLRLA